MIYCVWPQKLPVSCREEVVKEADAVPPRSWATVTSKLSYFGRQRKRAKPSGLRRDDEGNGLAAVSAVNFKMPVQGENPGFLALF